MTDQQIEKLVHNAEKSASYTSFLPAYIVGTVSIFLTPLMFVSEIGLGPGVLIAGTGWAFTSVLWLIGRDSSREIQGKQVQVVWRELGTVGVLGEYESPALSQLIGQIGAVYELDPEGEVLPIVQAVRLILAWKQQRERLVLIEHHVKKLVGLRDALQEKQKSLTELGDDNPSLQPTLARLNGDIEPLERSAEALRASCKRLETLVSTVDVAARRRQLHREIGELTAQVPLMAGAGMTGDVFDSEDEQLDIERQIGREIETYLKLEIETNAHLRDL